MASTVSVQAAGEASTMLVATLHCSDPACDAEVEIEVEDLRELDGWSCDCGYGLVLLSLTKLISI